MLRLAGLLLLFSSAALTGMYAAATLDERERELSRQLSFWRQFAIQLRCLHSTPAQLVAMLASQREYAGDRLVALLHSRLASDPSFGRGLAAALADCPALGRRGISAVLLPLGDVVGLHDIDSQLAALESVQLRLGELREQAAATARQKGGIYRKLGILGGLLLAVILY